MARVENTVVIRIESRIDLGYNVGIGGREIRLRV